MILAGVVVSIFFTELTGISAGLIVPGYLVLALDSPWRVAYTIALSLAAFGLLKLLSRWLILYGRRRFVLLILLTYLCHILLRSIGAVPSGFSAVGILIPGILAREIDRQGVRDTLLGVVISTALLTAILLVFNRGSIW